MTRPITPLGPSLRWLVAGLFALILPDSTWAQDTGARWGGNVIIVSDYRYHGVTLSDEQPVLQAELTYSGDGGFFAGAFVSQLADNDGEDLEMDLGAGYAAEVAGFDVTIGAVAYLYPGAGGDNLAEAYVAVEHPAGDNVTVGAEVRYAPEQDNYGVDNRYVGAFVAVSVGDRWTLSARGGHEDGFYNRKVDWSLGANYALGRLALGLARVGFEDANHREDATVLSLSARF